MPEPQYLAATLPLFEAGLVDTIEWSFDMSWRHGLPPWLAGVIADYESAGRLAGHGVSLSPLSNHPRQDRWFERFAHDVDNYQFNHVSEHFGFMAAGEFRLGPPLPLPMTNETLAIGQAHLARLARLTNGPVGLENLAFAFGTADVWTQGDFLDSLLAPTDGFLVLDVHNLWCQIHNFGTDVDDLLATYPLDRVRECHVSGGSWSTPEGAGPEGRIRRDTHDDDVPDEVFELLERVLALCPNVESIIVERLGHTFGDAKSDEQFRADYRRVRQIATTPIRPTRLTGQRTIRSNAAHAASYPGELMQLLGDAIHEKDSPTVIRQLQALDIDGSWATWAADMDPAMVEIAISLVDQWGRREPAPAS